jgi:sulfur-oxidizing protein SoxA
MRCPELLARALVAAVAFAPLAHGAPEDARKAVAATLQERLPAVAPADYALGAAALDPALRAEVDAHGADAAPIVAAGKALWQRKFRDGRTLATCFPNGGRRVAAAYPQYDPRLKRVITLETAINLCLRTHNEPQLDAQEAPMARVTAYLRTLSDGQKMAVRVPPAAEERFEQGRRMYFSRMGQRNYACASCHLANAGKFFGQSPLSPAIGQATHWPVVRNGEPLTLQMRMRECLELMGAAPFPSGSEELTQLEYFLAYLSNGLPLKANAWRPAPASR